MKGATIFLITVAVVASNQDLQLNYYWRDYLGPIPPDAVVAGKDADGTIAYIGQGYLRNHGIKPGRIIPGTPIMTVTWGQQNTLTKWTKILCGPQDKFYWMKVNASRLYVQLAHKHAVIGGHDDVDDGYLSIGRIILNGTVRIGKVVSYRHGDALLYYVNGAHERDVTEYEVLMYKTPNDKNSAAGSTRTIYLYLVLTVYVFLQL